jgi:hypothetical protein
MNLMFSSAYAGSVSASESGGRLPLIGMVADLAVA